ncbi:unnamed protein product [Musa banksii]
MQQGSVSKRWKKPSTRFIIAPLWFLVHGIVPPTCIDLPSWDPSFLSDFFAAGLRDFLSPRSSFHLMGAFGGRSLGCPHASSLPRSSSRRVVIIPLLEPEGWLSLSGRSLPLKKIWSAVIIGWLPTKNSKLGSGGGPGARTVGTSSVKSQENEMRGLIGGAGGAVPPPQPLW